LIGEAPAHDEVRLGRPFVGATGRLLDKFLTRVGIERGECYITNAVLCQLPKGKRDLAQAIRCCRPRLVEELTTINTGATTAVMGGIARDALYPDERGGILASRGWRRLPRLIVTLDNEGREVNVEIGPGRDAYVMAHPAYTLYNPNEAPMLLKDLRRLERGKCDPPKVKYTVLDTHEALEKFIEQLYWAEPGFIAFDLETDQIDHQRDRVLCMSLSVKYGQAYIIPDKLLYLDRHEFVTTRWTKQKWNRFLTDFRYYMGTYLQPDPRTAELLSKMFGLGGFTWAGHNMKFDLRFLVGQLGVVAPVSIFDTIVAHYTLDERPAGHGLKVLADDYYDSGDYEAELFQFIAKKSGRYSGIPRPVLYRYNSMDTELTLRLAYTLKAEMVALGLYEKPFLFPMMEAVPMLLEAELYGVNVDWEEMERIDKEEIEPELQVVAGGLREISGNPTLNPLSSKKVNDILYDQFHFPIIEVRTRAAGKRIKQRSSQVAVMDGWAQMWEQGKLHVSERAWHFATRLRYYRHIRKMRGSYARKWPRFRGTDSRIHTRFYLRGTVTGRLSSADPPMQTIPSKIKDKWSLLFANAHVPPKGWSLLYADYSQAELMVAACLSGDAFMINAFQGEDADYHSEVALAAYGPNFTRDERQHCKRLTFGWLFGGNVEEIALKALHFQGPVAKRFAAEWDDLFKTLVEWRKAQGAKMRKQGYVESVFGRRRRYLLLSDRNIGKAQRVAINAPIQSAVSDLNLISATRLYELYRNVEYAHVVLLIHDSLILEVRDEHVEDVAATMERVMVSTAAQYFPQVPFKAEVKVGKRLGDLT